MTQENKTYLIPSALVHKLIAAIFASLLAIGGYMAIWAIQDAAFKAEMRTMIEAQQRHLHRLNDALLKHLDGHPERVEDKVQSNQRRIERLEDR